MPIDDKNFLHRRLIGAKPNEEIHLDDYINRYQAETGVSVRHSASPDEIGGGGNIFRMRWLSRR